MGPLFCGETSLLQETQRHHRVKSLEIRVNERAPAPAVTGNVPTPESTVLRDIVASERDHTLFKVVFSCCDIFGSAVAPTSGTPTVD
jgi:hypothetical protein